MVRRKSSLTPLSSAEPTAPARRPSRQTERRTSWAATLGIEDALSALRADVPDEVGQLAVRRKSSLKLLAAAAAGGGAEQEAPPVPLLPTISTRMYDALTSACHGLPSASLSLLPSLFLPACPPLSLELPLLAVFARCPPTGIVAPSNPGGSEHRAVPSARTHAWPHVTVHDALPFALALQCAAAARRGPRRSEWRTRWWFQRPMWRRSRRWRRRRRCRC